MKYIPILKLLSAAGWAQNGGVIPPPDIVGAAGQIANAGNQAQAQAAQTALIRQQTKLLKRQTELLKKQNEALRKRQQSGGGPVFVQHKLMIFGGNDHKVYLGCLNCSEVATDSVLNNLGTHGSEFQGESVFNTFGRFGGEFSDNSPCNQYADYPPVIVDENGGFYGELTINQFRTERTKSEVVQKWLASVCAK